jgi:hypothetical protein
MPDQSAPSIKIHATLVKKINFACHQSAFAVLRELKIESLDNGADLHDLSVTLETSPGFIIKKTSMVDRLSPGGLLQLKDRDLKLDGAFFGLAAIHTFGRSFDYVR